MRSPRTMLSPRTMRSRQRLPSPRTAASRVLMASPHRAARMISRRSHGPTCSLRIGSTKDGLTGPEAAKRLKQYGPNEIAEKAENPFLKFLTYFWGPIPWMIEGAVVLSAVVQHWLDFGVILLLLCTNAVVGFWEEHQAGNAIAALEVQISGQGPRPARRQVDQSESRRTRARRRRSSAPGRHRARPMRACWRAIRSKSTSPR